MTNLKIEALKNFLGCEIEDINFNEDWDTYESEGYEYKIFTDDEANEEVEEYIKNTLWAFNSDFWLNFTNIEKNETIIQAFSKMQGELCESANDIILGIVGDEIDNLVESAIEEDGRGHFLSSYDGVENDEEIEGKYFYIYKI